MTFRNKISTMRRLAMIFPVQGTARAAAEPQRSISSIATPADTAPVAAPVEDPCAEVDCSAQDTSCSAAACDPSGAAGNYDIVTPKPAGTVCRASAAICDVEEMCDGVTTTCSADNLAPAGTVCRLGSGDLCDPDEVCTGSGKDCPVEFVEPATTVCRTSATGDEQCDPSEMCPGVPRMSCPPEFVTDAETPCGDDTVNSCTAADTCDGEGTCLMNNRACSLVTDSELCAFDLSPKGICIGGPDDMPTGDLCDLQTGSPACPEESRCVPENQFRVLFTPARQAGVAYKLTATNPGQFFYNLFSTGTPGTSETFNIRVPYPFITQGARPVHVYDGDLVGNVSGDDCFMPPEDPLATSDTQILMDHWIAGVATDPARQFLTCDQVCGPDGAGLCTFDVTATYPESGAVYINVHLDYGLKGPQLDANPCDDGAVDRYDRDTVASPWESFEAFLDTLDDRLDRTALTDCQSYRMSHEELSTSTEFADTVQNLNVFKGSVEGAGENMRRHRRGQRGFRGSGLRHRRHSGHNHSNR
ncbi:MAG: hypothetical protein ACE5HD_07130 [Acidobacteriota bacterium]